MVFDTAVNMGVGTAARMLQMAAGVTVDGEIGPATIAAAGADGVLDAFRDARIAHYQGLAGFPTYGKGWLDRVALAYAAAQTATA
jgi:lysozyme family protein